MRHHPPDTPQLANRYAHSTQAHAVISAKSASTLVFSGVGSGPRPFPGAHVDRQVRFLSTRCAAVAWNESIAEDRERAEAVEAAVNAALPGIAVLRLPMRSAGSAYASPLNWLQFGRRLLIPRYDLTPAGDVERILRTLSDAGFAASFIYSPTLEQGGSLHCLTASVHA